MRDIYLPTDKNLATDALSQRMHALIIIKKQMAKAELTKASEVKGLIDNMLDDIDDRLDSGDLWEIGND